jgi:hypothetical protein
MKINKLFLLAMLTTQLIGGTTVEDQSKTIQVEVDSTGMVLEFRVHNVSYKETAGLISSLSGFKIDASDVPDQKITFLAKKCGWDTVIRGGFNTDQVTLQKIDSKNYKVVRKNKNEVSEPSSQPIHGTNRRAN